MMGAGLTRNPDTVGLGPADKLHPPGTGDMEDVDTGAGQFGQGDFAIDENLLSGGRVTPQPKAHAFHAFVHDCAFGHFKIFRVA